jgi:hypothetical protein
MRDSMFDDTAVRMSLPPAIRAANGTVNGTAVDMAGTKNNFRSAMMVVFSGDMTDGTHTVALQDSDDGSTGWTTVTSDLIEGTYPAVTGTNDNAVYRVGYKGGKRYLRASLTTTAAPATPVGGTVGAVILLSQGSGRPIT